MVKLIVLLVVGVLLIVIVLDRLRKKQEKARFDEIQRRALAADHSGPTQTGKFRVQQMLQKTEPRPLSEQESIDAALDDESAPLPDPFDAGKNKK